MSTRLIHKFILLAVLAGLFLPVTHAAKNGGMEFYNKDEEGWFWHEKFPEPPKEEKKEKRPTPPAPPVPHPETAKTPEPEKQEGPAPMSVEWIRVNLPKFRDIAIDNPTQENINNYRTLQRVMLDKSSQFEMAWSKSIYQNPELDENLRRPLATGAASKSDDLARKNMKETLHRVAGKAGLWFFFASTCPYCEQEAPLIKSLERIYGFNVTAISLDRAPLKNVDFKNLRFDDGHAEQLNVTTTPTIYLVKPPNQFALVSTGFTALSELEERIMFAAKEGKFITDDEYDETRITRNNILNTNELSAAASELPQAEQSQNHDSDVLVQIRKTLKDKLK